MKYCLRFSVYAGLDCTRADPLLFLKNGNAQMSNKWAARSFFCVCLNFNRVPVDVFPLPASNFPRMHPIWYQGNLGFEFFVCRAVFSFVDLYYCTAVCTEAWCVAWAGWADRVLRGVSASLLFFFFCVFFVSSCLFVFYMCPALAARPLHVCHR